MRFSGVVLSTPRERYRDTWDGWTLRASRRMVGSSSLWEAHSVPKIANACGYPERYGAFTVGFAVGLKEHGLRVSFHSDPDSDIRAFEKRYYVRARRIGASPTACA
jgi:hypothetical protein